MLEHLTDSTSIERAQRAIRELVDAHSEWFLSAEIGAPQTSLQRSEFDFSSAHRRLIFSCWTEKGTRTWRVRGWEWTSDKLRLEAARRMGAERAILELIPRASAKSLTATVAAARHVRCEKLARAACEVLPGTKVERVGLSPGMRRGQPGRYARIVLRGAQKRIAVTGTVALGDARNIDSLFSSALLWLNRLLQKTRPPYIERLCLVVQRSCREAARERLALLRDGLRSLIMLYEIDDAWSEIAIVEPLERAGLWRKRLARFPPILKDKRSEAAHAIVAQTPEALDVVGARHGETFRYYGLSFARLRRVMGQDRMWFGIEGSRRRLLAEQTHEDWIRLLTELAEHRNAAARDQRHALYRSAGEAWLESILRRDITKLDPGLIIAPLHAQFRTSHGGPTGSRPIDLLALRQDGRLVVIELKVSEDREHVFQGVDYWRRVEAHRRRGHIAKAKLFGNRAISDEAPLVYLVAPTLRFHRTFATLARTVAPDIEIYRFDINENWRAGVRVMRRMRVN
ncbi:MAG: hypothetical protein ABJC05_11955 [Pyrinomonadaceae bacterium]